MRHQLLSKNYSQGNYYTYGMPKMEEFLKLRNGYNNLYEFDDVKNAASVIFFKVLMPSCGTHANYADKEHQELLSDIYSPSQEGFVLIELMNNYDKWMERAKELYEKNELDEDEECGGGDEDNIEATVEDDDPEEMEYPEETEDPEDIEKQIHKKKNTEGHKQSRERGELGDKSVCENNEEDEIGTQVTEKKHTKVGTLYTNSRFCVSMDGWSEAGMRKYNELCLRAEKDRESEQGKLFDKLYLDLAKISRIHKAERVFNKEEFIQPYNNLDDGTDEDSSDEENDETDDENEDHISDTNGDEENEEMGYRNDDRGFNNRHFGGLGYTNVKNVVQV